MNSCIDKNKIIGRSFSDHSEWSIVNSDALLKNICKCNTKKIAGTAISNILKATTSKRLYIKV